MMMSTAFTVAFFTSLAMIEICFVLVFLMRSTLFRCMLVMEITVALIVIFVKFFIEKFLLLLKFVKFMYHMFALGRMTFTKSSFLVEFMTLLTFLSLFLLGMIAFLDRTKETNDKKKRNIEMYIITKRFWKPKKSHCDNHILRE